MTVQNRAEALLGMHRRAEAKALLAEVAEQFDDAAIWQKLAWFHWHDQQDAQAIGLYRDHVLRLLPHSRRCWVEYARMVGIQDRSLMGDACRRVLDSRYFKLPEAEEDYYYADGQLPAGAAGAGPA